MPVNKVIILGSLLESSLEGSYSRAFKALDWTVHNWDPIVARAATSRGGRLGALFSHFISVEAWARKANLQILEMCRALRPTLILVIGTAGIRSGTLGQIKVILPMTPINCIYPDSPHNLDGERIACIPMFDHIAVSSPAWVAPFKRLGGANVTYLPFAADPGLHWPESRDALNPIYRSDVTFLGNWRSERELFLEGLTEFNLRIWGGVYWKSRTAPNSPLRKHWAKRTAVGSEFRQVCAGSGIMLNIMDAATWPGPNMRSFEQPACRAFSLMERTPAVVDIFTEGENVECFSSLDEARDKIRFYLSNEAARDRIAAAAYDFVTTRGHTYRDRTQTILSWR